VFGGIVSASYQARNLPFAAGAASPAVALSTPLSAPPPGAPATAAASGVDETLPPAPDPGIPTPPLPATGGGSIMPPDPPVPVASGLAPPTEGFPPPHAAANALEMSAARSQVDPDAQSFLMPRIGPPAASC
jgi:hypothetical protein